LAPCLDIVHCSSLDIIQIAAAARPSSQSEAVAAQSDSDAAEA
jgi:hypothetical protein